jgi:hypothetical protein
MTYRLKDGTRQFFEGEHEALTEIAAQYDQTLTELLDMIDEAVGLLDGEEPFTFNERPMIVRPDHFTDGKCNVPEPHHRINIMAARYQALRDAECVKIILSGEGGRPPDVAELIAMMLNTWEWQRFLASREPNLEAKAIYISAQLHCEQALNRVGVRIGAYAAKHYPEPQAHPYNPAAEATDENGQPWPQSSALLGVAGSREQDEFRLQRVRREAKANIKAVSPEPKKGQAS